MRGGWFGVCREKSGGEGLREFEAIHKVLTIVDESLVNLASNYATKNMVTSIQRTRKVLNSNLNKIDNYTMKDTVI